MGILSWISDEDLTEAVKQLLAVAARAKQQVASEFDRNVIDPFSALFQISGFGLDYESWIKGEQARQAQKTLQNHIGNFHQTVLGSVAGWENLRTGNVMDLLSVEKNVIAEIKNKHNTVKGSDLSGLYKSMENAVMPKSSRYKDFSAYYVTVIPKKPGRFDKPFTPSDKETGQQLGCNEKIRTIDGASFYQMVTGEPEALKQLFDCLPRILTSLTGSSFSTDAKNHLMDFFGSAYGRPSPQTQMFPDQPQ